jgi:hypothetical protein
MRVKNGVEPINHTADTARGGSRPKPPKAVAQRASLEAPGAVSEHQTAKRRLTAKTVALDSAEGAALGTDYFSVVGVGVSRHRLAGGPGGKAPWAEPPARPLPA